jgi:hypothetical protein
MTYDLFSGGIRGKAKRIEVPGALGSPAIDGDSFTQIRKRPSTKGYSNLVNPVVVVT